MKKLLILLVFVSVFAQETTHTVKEGDTLWDIAGFYYQNPFLWPFVWRANLTNIADPHWIYPDQVFLIPPSPEEALAEAPAEAPAEVPQEIPPYVPEEEITMLPMEQPTEVISVVEPTDRIFTEELIHRAGFLVDDDIPYWGKIVGTEPGDEKNITTFKTIYIDRSDIRIDDKLTIYRPGDVITHPKTGKRLGKEMIILGQASIEAVGTEGARAKVIQSYDIIKQGDLLTPYEPVLAPENVELIPTTKEIEGYVVEVKSAERLTPPHVFAYIDQGEEAGIAVGDIFDVYQKRQAGGKEMPDFTIGRIQVISVFRDASVGLVLANRQAFPIKRGELCRLMSEAR